MQQRRLQRLAVVGVRPSRRRRLSSGGGGGGPAAADGHRDHPKHVRAARAPAPGLLPAAAPRARGGGRALRHVPHRARGGPHPGGAGDHRARRRGGAQLHGEHERRQDVRLLLGRAGAVRAVRLRGQDRRRHLLPGGGAGGVAAREGAAGRVPGLPDALPLAAREAVHVRDGVRRVVGRGGVDRRHAGAPGRPPRLGGRRLRRVAAQGRQVQERVQRGAQDVRLLGQGDGHGHQLLPARAHRRRRGRAQAQGPPQVGAHAPLLQRHPGAQAIQAISS